MRDERLRKGDEETDKSFMDTTDTVSSALGGERSQRDLYLCNLEQTATHKGISCESGRTVMGQETSRTGKNQSSLKIEVDGCPLSAYNVAASATSETNVDSRSLVDHETGSSNRTLAGQCGST